MEGSPRDRARRDASRPVLLVSLFGLFGWAALGHYLIGSALGADAQILPSQIAYSVTIRSFMPTLCRKDKKDDPKFNDYCPDDEAIRNMVEQGELSGHPDFERLNPDGAALYNVTGGSTTSAYKGPYTIDENKTFPVTSKHGTNDDYPVLPFVLSDLQFNTTGIGKMQYCHGEEGYECDSQKDVRVVYDEDSFATWYSDSRRYNRRIGYKQPLYQSASDVYQYEFDAANPDYNPIGNGLFDPISIFGLRAEAWPLSKFEKDGGKNCPSSNENPCPLLSKPGKFWFTTELHTYFQYRGGEEFHFSGDDDIHVFINNRLAINMGGEHSALPVSIALDSYAEELNITKGGIYAFDLFHAERQTSGSNFQLTTTLSEACNVVSLDLRSNGTEVTQGINWKSDPGLFPASKNSEWFLLGGQGFAVIPEPTHGLFATLMRPGVSDVAAYMFHRSRHNVGSGFSLSFQFRASGFGHGFAVVFHDRLGGLSNFNGGSGPNLGIRNLERSMAILFDFCPDFPDCASGKQQLRIHHPSVLSESNSNSIKTRRVYDNDVQQNWRDGKEHTVVVSYYRTPDWLEVYVDDSLRLVLRDFDIENVIGGLNAFVGFTSSSSLSGSDMTVEIGEVSVTTVKVSSHQATTVNDVLPIPLYADGKQKAGLRIQSRDGCGTEVRYGGLASLAKGRAIMRVRRNSSSIPNLRRRQLQEDDDMVILEKDAEVVDNEDGTYSLLFTSDSIGSASLHVAFGASCAWNGTEYVGEEDCFHEAYPDAMAIIPPATPAPTIPRSDPDDVKYPWAIVMGVGVGLAAISVCCCFVALCLLRYRRKWREEKRYVPTGQLAVLEQDVDLAKDPLGEKISEFSRKFQETSLEINKLRAVSDKSGTTNDIKVLRDENEKLKEAIKGRKRRQQENEIEEETRNQRINREFYGQRTRKSFAADQIDGGAIVGPAEVTIDLSDNTPITIVPVFVPRHNPHGQFTVSLPQRDVDDMIQHANDHSEVLVGGELYGQIYENGDMIVMHATGPGNGCIMDKDNFVQNPSFVSEATALMGRNSSFRLGSWISTSTSGKPVPDILKLASTAAHSAMPHSRHVLVLLVQLCGIKEGTMVTTITPYRYDRPAASGTIVGHLHVYDDIDPSSKRRHDALEVLRSRPPVTPLVSAPAPPPGPPPKRRFDDAMPPVPPPSRPLGQPLGAGPPPKLPPSRPVEPPETSQDVPTPRRFSITEEDENPLMPAIADGSVDDTQANQGDRRFIKKSFFGAGQ